MKLTFGVVVLSAALTVVGAGCSSSADESATAPAAPEASGSGADNKEATLPPASPPASTNAPANGLVYRINSGQSQFTAHVGVGGIFSSLGHAHTIAITSFTGDVRLTPGSLQPASLQMTIRADSLAETDKEFDEKDRQKVNQAMRTEALETGSFPTITFKSTDISVNKQSESRYQAKITGALTLHGVTRTVSFPAQVTLDGNALRATGAFTVNHSDYKMKRISAGGGTVKAEEAIKLSFNIVANKT
ncbi:MAG TPA: YceI family protein [Blastocatellia bacterium]|nr:YceI family protein [Blastocatellia bacterium]